MTVRRDLDAGAGSGLSPALAGGVEVAPAGGTLALARGVEPPTPRDVLRHFLAGRCANTVNAYRADLEKYAAWRSAQDAEHAMAELLAGGPQRAHQLALGWLNSMAAHAPATRSRRLAALRSFVDLAGQLGVISWSLKLRGPKVKKWRDTRGPALTDLQRVLAVCGDDPEGRRNRALVVVICSLGLRRAEAACLTVGDYDRERSRLRIIGKGSGGQPEWVTLPAEIVQELDEWLCASRSIGCSGGVGDPATPLFVALDRKGIEPITPGGIYYVLRKLGERSGVRLRPHGLRHAAVTTVLDESQGNVRMAQSFARHGSPATTMVYDDNRRDLAGQAAGLVAGRLLSRIS
ncbi:MAG: tyrosine-type recombinase/integrase [Myxococcales bacterium]|nr:tyrosine-type recombinase/integrase [Myxococcales bacterium]